MAVERLRRGQMGVRYEKLEPVLIHKAVSDIKIWVVTLMMAGT